MGLKKQITSFDRTEEYDSVLSTWKRKIKPNNLMNLTTAVTTTTTGDVSLITTVVGANEEVYIYGVSSAIGTSGIALAIQVDSANVFTINSNMSNTLSNPDAPIAVVQASSTIGLVVLETTVTDETFIVNLVAKIEPLPAKAEPQLG